MNLISSMKYLVNCVTLVALFFTSAVYGKEYVLTDSDTGASRSQFTMSNKDFAASRSPNWTVEKRVLHGGKQEGSELIVIDNGKLEFAVSPTRGMNIVYLRCKGEQEFPVGWKSPVQEVVHPMFVDLESRGGLGWLDGFNEWMCRCGLEFAGHPGKDVFTNNTGDKAELDLTLHGKIANIPASRVVFSVDEKPPYRLRIKGTVYERSFHGPKLKLETEVTTVPGRLEIDLHDRITNESANVQEYQVIYHTNYGDPILEEGARVVAAFKRLEPMNAHAAQHIAQWDTYAGPTDGFVEDVYLGYAASGSNGETSILLENAGRSRGSSITWNANELPYVTVWKYTASKADGYVTGLEPGTGFPFNRWIERQFDRVPKLQPGQSREFSLTFAVHPDTKSLDSKRKQIEAIQQGHPMVVEKAPPEVPEFQGPTE